MSESTRRDGSVPPEKRDEVLKLIREAEDLMVEVKKVLQVFDATENWHKKYDDPTLDRIDTFNHLNLDPRIIAGRGYSDADKVAEKLRAMWTLIMEVVRG